MSKQAKRKTSPGLQALAMMKKNRDKVLAKSSQGQSAAYAKTSGGSLEGGGVLLIGNKILVQCRLTLVNCDSSMALARSLLQASS
jgi:hypothetical protein